jgi:hypothetical protein
MTRRAMPERPSSAGRSRRVDAGRRIVTPSDSDPLDYDALVLAVGAQAVPVVEHAMTWDDRVDAETIGACSATSRRATAGAWRS